MSDRPQGGALRSAGAVAAGFFATAVLSLGTDVALHAVGVYPPWGKPMSNPLFVLATVYRVLYTVFGGYVTARMAAARPMKHVWILGSIGMAFATFGAVATWNAGPDFGPHWYPVALVVTALPCVWLGGKIATRSHDAP